MIRIRHLDYLMLESIWDLFSDTRVIDSSKKNSTNYKSDGLLNCLLQPGLFYLSIQKSMREEFNLLIKSCATRTVPSAETKSIVLQADAQMSWFLHATLTTLS